MKKTSLVSTFILMLFFVSNAQVRFNALPNNPVLKNQAVASETRKSANDIPIIHVYTEGNFGLCVNDFSVGTVNNFSAELINADAIGMVFTTDTCLIYQANNQTGQDTLSIELELEEETLNFLRIVEVRSPIEIPWMDDFSYVNLAKGRPNQENWLDRTVYVNDHLAYHPPSLGVASFDGLDANGEPYNTGFGSSDTLTSSFFDLSNYAPGDSVFLSFVYQPMGLSLSPVSRDKFVLEFRDEDGNWETIFEDNTNELDFNDPEEPSYEEIAIIDTKYFFPGFQFRFRNFGPKSGFLNFWHLDYIRLIPNFFPSDSVLTNEDIALGHSPFTLFKEHTAIPMRQFLANPDEMIADFLRVDIMNHFDRVVSVPAATYSVVEVLSGEEVSNDEQLLETDADGNLLRDIPQQMFTEWESYIPSDVRSNLVNDMTQALSGLEEAVLTTQYRLNTTNEDEGVFPSLEQNGIANAENYLAGYYAYDDGTAEINLELSGGFRIATRYTMQVEDTLAGILIYLPLIDGDLSANSFSIEIKRSLTDVAIYEDNFATVEHSNIYDIPNFSYYEIEAPLGDGTGLEIDPGEFYVVIRSQQGLLNLGYDRQMDSRTNQFVRLSQNRWVSFDDPDFGAPSGSVMSRPVFKSFTNIVLNQDEAALEKENLVYPNPINDFFIVQEDLVGASLEVFNSAGMMVFQGDVEAKEVRLTGINPGYYLLKFTKNDVVHRVPVIKVGQ